jgi:hypothetical protein
MENLPGIELLTKEHFENVLQQALNQVFNGKGNERHGHGLTLDQQPWKIISDNVGTGFVVGQAIKKMLELKTFVPKTNDPQEVQAAYAAWKREALGAIVYITMAIMYKDFEINKL